MQVLKYLGFFPKKTDSFTYLTLSSEWCFHTLQKSFAKMTPANGFKTVNSENFTPMESNNCTVVNVYVFSSPKCLIQLDCPVHLTVCDSLL